jgi:hypothetical protein
MLRLSIEELRQSFGLRGCVYKRADSPDRARIEDILLKIINKIGKEALWASLPGWVDDRSFVLRVLEQRPEASQYVGKLLRRDLSFWIAAIAANQQAYGGSPDSPDRSKMEVLLLEAIKKSGGWALLVCPRRWVNDKKFMLRVLEQRPRASRYVGEVLRRDASFWVAAIAANRQVYNYLSVSFEAGGVNAEGLDLPELTVLHRTIFSSEPFHLLYPEMRYSKSENLKIKSEGFFRTFPHNPQKTTSR